VRLRRFGASAPFTTDFSITTAVLVGDLNFLLLFCTGSSCPNELVLLLLLLLLLSLSLLLLLLLQLSVIFSRLSVRDPLLNDLDEFIAERELEHVSVCSSAWALTHSAQTACFCKRSAR
jgi:hypothetical protein